VSCIFCTLDKSKRENTILEETTYFYVIPAVGSLVVGYVLILCKRHIYSMAELNNKEQKEYENLIEKYRNIFKNIYKKYPIVFEHGSPNIENKTKANSIDHAHTHIVNYQYKNEEKIIKNLNFNPIGELTQLTKKQNYILYINPNKVIYMTTNFPSISQLMRLVMAKELKIESKYKWEKETFKENIEQTIIDITTSLTNNSKK
jgi:hypothetical protein